MVAVDVLKRLIAPDKAITSANSAIISPKNIPLLAKMAVQSAGFDSRNKDASVVTTNASVIFTYTLRITIDTYLLNDRSAANELADCCGSLPKL